MYEWLCRLDSIHLMKCCVLSHETSKRNMPDAWSSDAWSSMPSLLFTAAYPIVFTSVK